MNLESTFLLAFVGVLYLVLLFATLGSRPFRRWLIETLIRYDLRS